jgi:cobalt-zinc-cadmium efflux system outer membrane protein
MKFLFEPTGSARVRRARNPLLARYVGVIALSIGLTAPLCTFAMPVTLNEALARALSKSPSKASAQARIAGAEASARQAGLKPNPTIGVDFENAGGTGPYSMLDRSETTVYYQQTLERGGKRQARSDLARQDIAIVRLNQAIAQLDQFAEIETLWIDAMAADAEVRLAQERLKSAERSQAEITRRVKGVRDPLFAASQIGAERNLAQLNAEMATQRALAARYAVAAYWNGTADFEIDGSDFGQIERLTAALSSDVGPQPLELSLLEKELDRANARIRFEQTRATQDVSVKGGVRFFADGRDAAFIVGGSIPLGRFDTNAGNIDHARQEVLALNSDIEAARLEWLRERARILTRMSASAAELKRIDEDVLPLAVTALGQIREGYARGGFRHTDIIEASTYIETLHERRIALLKSWHLERVRLNRLDGRHSDLLQVTDSQ